MPFHRRDGLPELHENSEGRLVAQIKLFRKHIYGEIMRGSYSSKDGVPMLLVSTEAPGLYPTFFME